MGYEGSLHTRVMLFCSIFSARSALISDGATNGEKRGGGRDEKGRRRQEMSFWGLQSHSI